MPFDQIPEYLSSFQDKKAAVIDFLLGGKNVCPFGRESAKHDDKIIYIDADTNSIKRHKTDELEEKIRLFIKGKVPNLIFIGANDPKNHEEGIIACRELYFFIGESIDKEIYEVDPAYAKRKWENIRKNTNGTEGLESDFYSYAPQLERPFGIVMGPQFKANHPRWAPHLIVVVNRLGDILEASIEDPKTYMSINRRVIRGLISSELLKRDETGVKYDNHFYPQKMVRT